MMIEKNRTEKSRIKKTRPEKNRPWLVLEKALILCVCCVLLGGCGYGDKSGTILIGAEDPGRKASGETGTAAVPAGNTGTIQSAGNAEDSGNAGRTEGSGISEDARGTAPGVIRVYVCGAVADPGVVELPEGSRAEDALLAAGGFREDAGREAVNLADWVTDGQMLYFPTAQEAEDRAYAREDGGAQAGEPGLVNINTADAAQLCTLPGIGESRAADIIAYREKNGGFESCEDIMKVPGIKTGAYEKIRDKIRVR